MIEPRVERILARNPSPMTLEGTNTYLVFGDGDGEALAIDPGPVDDQHTESILRTAARRGARIAAIAVTHGHPDHFPGAAPLQALTGAPVYAHRNARFPYDRSLCEGESLSIEGASLDVLEAPGHARDHVVLALEREAALFTGDVVIGRGTVVIAPPDGNMRDYQATLARLRRDYGHLRTLFGGHGEPVLDARRKLDEYIAHRAAREREILGALGRGERTIPQIVADVYAGVAKVLWPAAGRQVLAYLLALESEGRVRVRVLERRPSESEAAILHPDLAQIADPATAAVAAAELGNESSRSTLDAYCIA